MFTHILLYAAIAPLLHFWLKRFKNYVCIYGSDIKMWNCLFVMFTCSLFNLQCLCYNAILTFFCCGFI